MMNQNIHEVDDAVLAEVNGGTLLELIKKMIGWDEMVKAYNDGYQAGQY